MLDLADLESDHYVENQFGIDRKNLRRWRKQKDTLLSIDNKNKARIPGGGRKTFLSEEEQSNIINWIKQNRDLKISITTFAIGLYIQKIKPSFKEKNLHAQQQLIYRFLHRNGYVFRKPSHLGQILPQNYSDLFLAFQKKIISFRKKYDINDNEIGRLVNCDETPIYMEMVTDKTIEIKGAKDIEVATFGGEKVRISLILSCAADGTKLAPILIFKAKNEGNLEKSLNKIPIVKSGKIFCYCQPNAWCDNDIFIKWLKFIYLPYQNYVIKKKCLLILDKAPSHCSEETIDFMNKNEIKRIFIPGGLTRKLQPLDIAVNKPFKDNLKKCYTQYQLENYNNTITNKQAKVDRKKIVEWVNGIWDKEIDNGVICNGFKKTGISCNNNGSEDELVINNEEIEEDLYNYENIELKKENVFEVNSNESDSLDESDDIK